MKVPSFTAIISTIILIYIAHSIWTLSLLFSAPFCTTKPCFSSYLRDNPKLQLGIFTSHASNPISSTEVNHVFTFKKFNYNVPQNRDFTIPIPPQTRKNGTLYLLLVLASSEGELEWKTLKRDGPTVIQKIALAEYALPKAARFNLIKDSTQQSSAQQSYITKPVAHFRPKIHFSVMNDHFQMGNADVPHELAHLIRVNRNNEFMPIIQNDFLQTRMGDLEEIKPNDETMDLTLHYKPIGVGKLRLILHVEHALRSMKQLGFSNKDLDDMKGIFSDTNLYLLCGTVLIGGLHLLFDFLSFKSDIAFWRSKKTYAGLSIRTTLWRGFSHIIIFLYLLDENTSLLVLIPAGIGTFIELWKCKKILKIEISTTGIAFKANTQDEDAEKLTREIDKEAMKYLTYLLYPLCVCGAIYSLIYQPHKSWYSWTINSLVNGVYVFGFLFMLPQLFVNYKLKSVAALPWRAFMYKAFNTFIDDIFAFVITMPTAHRLACFRDDIVFIIYLYQRWLYPVDKSRHDNGDTVTTADEADKTVVEKKKTN